MAPILGQAGFHLHGHSATMANRRYARPIVRLGARGHLDDLDQVA